MMDLSQSLLFASRFASGEHDPAGHQEFLAWAAEAGTADLETVARAYEQASEPAFKMPGDLWTIQLEAKLDKFEASSPIRILPAKRILYWRWAAAAASVIFVTLGAYYLINRKTEKPISIIQQTQNKNDVAPGGNKAILTLGNGSKVVLDSLHNGTLAQQGNAKVLKLDSGKLEYAALNANAGSVMYNTLTTPRGGQYQLQLSDGTKVWLDAASSITYPTAFIGKQRKVEVSGQVYFEVVHKANMPFLVQTNGMEIRDIGTTFNVDAYSDEPASRITLVDGSIQIKNKSQNFLLKPGQQVISEDGTMALSKSVDIEQVLAWKNGLFKLGGAGIHEIMRQVSRWYDVDISYEGNLDKAVFSGIISRREKVSGLIRVLEATGSVHFDINERTITVKP